MPSSETFLKLEETLAAPDQAQPGQDAAQSHTSNSFLLCPLLYPWGPSASFRSG